jgi:hypothetical protein
MSRQELLAKIYSELVVKTLMVVGPVEVETYSDV